MRMETFIRKALRLKVHQVVAVVEPTPGELVATVQRVGQRPLRCSRCGRSAARVVGTRRPVRQWRDLAMREHRLVVEYAPYRIWCRHCGLRVEGVPWADPWQRVTHALARAVAVLARELHWAAVAAHFRLNWKTVASVVEATVLWGLAHHRAPRLRVIGIDEVSRRKGQQYLTMVYDLQRGRVVWVGRDRTRATLERFFRWLGPRRMRSIETVCSDMAAAYGDAVRHYLPHATHVVDRFHVSQHLSRAIDEVRRQTWRRLTGRARVTWKHTRFLWLHNPENLRRTQRTRLSALLRLNAPIVRAYLLKEDLRRFWRYRAPHWAQAHLDHWLWRAAHSRLLPFKKVVATLRTHRAGILAWTRLRISNGALEGMNNKVKVISHRAYGFSTSWAYIANIYHCCAALPLP